MIRESFIFCAFTTWIKGIIQLATSNDYSPLFASAFTVLGVTAADLMVTDETFGTTRMVIFLVIVTVLLNTIYGIKKSLMQQKILFARALKYPFNSKEYNIFHKRSLKYKFNIQKLNFVFFKCFTFLGYLYFAQKLLEGDATFLDFSAEILAKVPLAFFWYYEFKSFGENSTIVYGGKKASIFTIVEGIFEPKISRLFGKNTPTDGHESDIELNPEDYGIYHKDFNDITEEEMAAEEDQIDKNNT